MRPDTSDRQPNPLRLPPRLAPVPLTTLTAMGRRPSLAKSAVLVTGVALGLMPACTSKSPGKPVATSATTTPMADVVGRLHVAGGPAPGIDKPIPGRIEAHRDTQAGQVAATADAGDDGAFHMTLPPGSYVLVATSPNVVLGRPGTACGSASLTVGGGANPPVTVYCLIP